MPQSPWTDVGPLEALPLEAPALRVLDGNRVVLVRLPDDAVHAVDDQCPHEGYPLSKGTLQGCVLTCLWHNFKFDVRTGHCLKGDEAVRLYPTRVVDGAVQVDLTPPPPEAAIARSRRSLAEALRTPRVGQALRDVARLLHLGVPATDLAAALAADDAERAEYGTTHVLAVLAVLLESLPAEPPLAAVAPLGLAVELLAEAHPGRSPRTPRPSIDPGDDFDAAGERLRAAVEAERVDEALGLVQGACARGWSRRIPGSWFLPLVADHFLDFGHALLYAVHVEDLLDRVGWHHAPAILPGLVLRIVHGTREDTLPTWRWFTTRLGALEPELAALRAVPGTVPVAPEALVTALLDGPREAAVTAPLEALRAGVTLEAVMDAIVYVASERILRFDPAHDPDDHVQEGWLDVTHTLTFARGVRLALGRWPHPRALRLLFQAARFAHHARNLDAPGGLVLPPPDPAATLDDLASALRRHDPSAALSAAQGYLAAGGPMDPLRALLLGHATADTSATRPIFAAHLLKTVAAALAETEALPEGPRRTLPLLAAVRLLASSLRERQTTRLAHEAIQLVAHGKVPRTLT